MYRTTINFRFIKFMAFRILGIRCSDLKIHCTFVCLLAHNFLYKLFLFQIANAYGAAGLIIQGFGLDSFSYCYQFSIYVGNIGSLGFK